MSAGFAWSSVAGAVAKLREEQAELDEALASSGLDRDAKAAASAEQRAAVEAELGDVLLAAAFLANYLKLDPERLCRSALARFERRFRSMEQELASPLQQHDLEQWMQAWGRAKRQEG
jgi:nucleoside triphosphate diphosphatase